MYDCVTAGTGLPLTSALLLSYLNSEAIYFWQQTAEDITVCVRMPEGFTKEEVQFRLTADNICIGVQGFPPLLDGQLHASVDPEASAWAIKNDKRFATSNVQSFLWLVPVYWSESVEVRLKAAHHIQSWFGLKLLNEKPYCSRIISICSLLWDSS